MALKEYEPQKDPLLKKKIKKKKRQLVPYDLSDPIKIHEIYWEKGHLESLKLNFSGKCK